jgi:hypothetical protein
MRRLSALAALALAAAAPRAAAVASASATAAATASGSEAAVGSGFGVKTITSPYIRANDQLDHMRLDPKGRFLAFIGPGGMGLSVVDIKSKSIWKVSEGQVGQSFFWAPDGYRLFYREQARAATGEHVGQISSTLRAYDAYLNRSVTIDDMPFATGLLTFDPRDLRMHLLGPKGIRTKRIYFPDERLAKWQVAQRNESGRWLATQRGILWVTQGGYAMRRLEDDGTELQSFDISPDGTTMAWATAGGRVYSSKDGRTPVQIGYGRDPQWHPNRPLLLYAGARMVGNKAVSYDLRISDTKGVGKFLTSTQFSDERWPQWHPKGHQILYTMARTTDVFVLDFKQ